MAKKRSVAMGDATCSAGAAPAPQRKRTRKAAPKDTVPEALAVVSAASTVGEREEIERLAHSYWVERGGEGGSPEEDWFRAEAEVRRRRGQRS